MENISFKQWIIAGTLSGVVIGGLVFFVGASICISDYDVMLMKFSIFTFFHYVFYGIVIGAVLFSIRGRLQQR